MKFRLEVEGSLKIEKVALSCCRHSARNCRRLTVLEEMLSALIVFKKEEVVPFTGF